MKVTLTCLQRPPFSRAAVPLLYVLAVLVALHQLQSSLPSPVSRPAAAAAAAVRGTDRLLPATRAPAAVMLPQRGPGREPHLFQRLEEKGAEVTGWYNAPNCSVVDFLAGPDPTAREAYDHSLVCGPAARAKDVICAFFFSRMDLQDDGDCFRQHDDTKVPRVVYYVIFGQFEFKFLHYVSVVAAKRFIRPSGLYVIGDMQPYGPWWQRLMEDVKGVRFMYRPRMSTIGGKGVKFVHHVSDLVRLQVVLLNGGIYLDAGTVMVRDPEPILKYDTTMSLIENGTDMGNAFIAAKRNSPFVREWYANYNHYNNSKFFLNSLHVPRDMWHRNSSRIHMESKWVYRPNWFEADQMFKGWNDDWRQNYAVYVWTNGNPVPRSEEEVRTSNTTVANVFRNALYGDPGPR